MRKLKIMWFHSHLTIPGGGARFMLEGIRELSKNHHIKLYVQKSSPNLVKQFNDASIDVVTMNDTSTGDPKFWLNFSSQINKEIKFLKDEAKNYDVVISSMFPMNVEANALGLPHLQCCFQPYAFFWDSMMVGKLPFVQRLLLRFARFKFGKLDIEATKKSDIVVTMNPDIQKWITSIYQRDSIVAYAGVDTSFFKPTTNLDLEKKYANKKIILHSTDWTPLKRTNWLIDQFLELRSKMDNLILLIMEVKNNGVERDIALKKIKENNIENIELCGFVPENLLPAYYSLADACVYAGIGEGAAAASYIVLESMACGTPVVRTNYTKNEVEHGKTGFLFDKDDKENFQKYVSELINNKELNLQFGKDARHFVEETRSWKKFAEIYEKNLLEIVD